MGRKTKEDPNHFYVSVRMTQIEKETIDVYAKMHKMSISDVVKDVVFEHILKDDDTMFYYENRGKILERKRAEAKERAKEEARRAERLKWEAERESQKSNNL